MKKKFCLLLVCLIFSVSVRAEESANGNKTQLHFLFFGGFNSTKTITDLNSKNAVYSEAKQNYNFGAGLRLELGLIFIQPEVYFTRKGGLASTFRDTFDQHHVDAQSIDFPVMAGLRLFHSNKFCLRAYGGPVFSYLKNKDVEIKKNGQIIPWSDIEANTKAFSMQIGAGVDITRRFTFDVRYEYAFSPMFKISDLKTHYRILYFTAGLKLF
ncbi:MAG: PorT family protein [Bacteroidales bacterium]|jgi:opacity protein-like surface antigen|nr:PorT family protein [Bacteroidales bacterium]